MYKKMSSPDIEVLGTGEARDNEIWLGYWERVWNFKYMDLY